MTRQMNNLFDPERRKAVREAVRRGQGIFADRGKAEAPAGASGIPPASGLNLPPASFVFISNTPLFKIGGRTYTPDEYLMLAIQYCDLEAVKSAINNGANVNHTVDFLPVTPDCDAVHPTRIGDPSVKTPLQYALKLGKVEIVKFLKRHGANE